MDDRAVPVVADRATADAGRVAADAGHATADAGRVAAVDAAIHRLQCAMSPRAMARLAGDGLPLPPHYNSVPLLSAISYWHADDDGCAEVTVGGIAERMYLDPSRASRMVTAAIAAGHVTRLASQADGRRTVLALTPAGRAVLADAQRFRHARYDRVMAGWTAQERAEFASLLTRFTEGL